LRDLSPRVFVNMKQPPVERAGASLPFREGSAGALSSGRERLTRFSRTAQRRCSRTPSSLASSPSSIPLVRAAQLRLQHSAVVVPPQMAAACLRAPHWAGCRRARSRACALCSPRASHCTRARSGSKPLQIWKEEVNNGHCKRITDNDIQSSVLEIMSTNISTTFVTCPNFSDRTLGIKLPFLVMIIKNVRRAPQRLARRSALPPEHSRRARTAARLRRTATHARCSATSRRLPLPLLAILSLAHVRALLAPLMSAAQEVLHLRGAGPGRQERAPPLPRVELPVHDAREAFHLHDAHAPRRGLEPDPVQPLRLHPPRVRHQLHRDAARADPRQLPHPPHLFLRPPLLRGGAPARVQALPPHPEAGACLSLLTPAPERALGVTAVSTTQRCRFALRLAGCFGRRAHGGARTHCWTPLAGVARSGGRRELVWATPALRLREWARARPRSLRQLERLSPRGSRCGFVLVVTCEPLIDVARHGVCRVLCPQDYCATRV